ncbi:hypothetical protein LTR10_014055 [Elasticomyces elasticus]|uniref:Uncharacterized protein n=1 Tax=Exophiala sideris TaxID=1016849 RepID=A0ABR0J3I7_9EURO|nr:hypothetical protein LTR10_014055 [Elasticomyces elasticus]KAK5026461.1 hypothetical protein LTS07_007395 [Exophiala sideris]KAK5033797.1 hypothetical protein LTR13_006849 [Exophiala sideris]KAK5055619.1 hypothetical protein LTR69_008452 [Exophiala sideris]KAK5179996.1 hypothetical protein LTR44_007472 [Eurotiomycetes sp. CCFEE 6388]
MPSASPSPMKRPSLTERTSSTHSLSSSGKQTTTHKVHRPHVVSRHSRNASHGKGLSKLGKVHSTASIITNQHHQRKKSGGTTPPQSPRTALVKRNSSHVTLPKNLSHGNLRKNHSATALARNTSHPALKKAGLPPPAPKQNEKKDGVFQLGDRSSDDEEEAEWEDSATQSPEMTRNNSKTATPVRVGTPNGAHGSEEFADRVLVDRTRRASSPPKPSLKNNNRSAPNLREDSGISPSHLPPDPALLNQHPRASRAPPAMSTVSAQVGPRELLRNESSRSITHISQGEAASINATAAKSGAGSSQAAASSSVDGGVSHFLPDTTNSSFQHDADGSDDDSPSTFLSNYKPQPSESPEKARRLHKVRLPPNASRTQQKLELQRREIMRAGAATPTTPPTHGMGLNGSSTSLHSRTSSRNRNRSLAGGRSLAGELKAVKPDYETAVKQVMVVRKFRSPIMESVSRLKESNILPPELGRVHSNLASSKGRPFSRRGYSTTSANGTLKTGTSKSPERKRPLLASRSSSRSHVGRVHFERRNSHDDIEVTPAQGSPDDAEDDEEEGLSAEEALIRRIWDSREVYDSGESIPSR